MNAVRFIFVSLFSIALLLPTLGVTQDRLTHLSVIALAPLDGRAVLRGPDAILQLIQQGDQLPGTQATLLQVLPDKLIVEDQITEPKTPLKTQIVWIYRAPTDGGRSRILRLKKNLPTSKQVLMHGINHPTRLQP